jgi:hypothetical protein
MNPELFNRILAGSFVKVVLKEEVSLSGYAGADLEKPELIRLDAMVLGEQGYLEKVSLHLTQDDIAAVQFLPEAPLFVDGDGNEIRMESGFFKDL